MMERQIINIKPVGDILFRKSRKAKRINISIKPFKGVTVSVPRYVTFKQAVKVVKNKTDWILEHQKKMKESEEKATIFDEYTSFNTRKHKLQIIKYDKKDVLVKITQDKTIISYPSSFDVGSDYVQQSIKWGITETLRIEANEYFPSKVDELAKKFGFSYNKLFIKNIKSRWGSCSTKNNINLSLHLILLPDRLIDYVILHELSHTIEKNHGKNFWELLNKVSPQAKSLDKELKEYKIMF